MSDTAIRIENVNKRFGATHAVRDLDVAVPAGSLCGFLGPNGAGKSTTIRMIMSIIYPDSGSIEVLGATALANKNRIGYLPEERGLYRKMRVGEFLEYIARLKGARRGGGSRTIEQWLQRVELPGVARKRCQELSKGMQQKVQFLASIIHEPDLLILDEPFSGLDPVNAELINRLIDELRRAGKTVILSTHVLHQAEQICDRILLINHGVKLLDATLEEIRRAFDPRTIVAEPTNGALQVADIDGVVNVQPIGHGGAVEIMIEEGADPQAIMQTVLSRQPVRRIELRRPTLEDVFVQLVMEDEGAAAAARAREGLGHV